MARRRRSKSWKVSPRLLVVGVLILILLGLVVNGIISSARSSNSYETLVNQSFGLQANSIISAQKIQGQQLGALLVNAPSMTRSELTQQLNALLLTTDQSQKNAQRAASPPPSGGAGSAFASVVSDRAQGVTLIEQGIAGLLGLNGPSGTPTSVALLSATQSSADLKRAAGLLSSAQRALPAIRSSLVHAPGKVLLHRSPFVIDPSLLTNSSMDQLVLSLSTSSTLTVTQQLSLSTVSLTPTPLPVVGAINTITLPPAHSLTVTLVVTNNGNVGENPVVATAELSPAGVGLSQRVKVSSSVGAGGVVSLVLPVLRLTPGTTVTLVVTLNPAPGQQDRTGLTRSFTVVVAPASSPPKG